MFYFYSVPLYVHRYWRATQNLLKKKQVQGSGIHKTDTGILRAAINLVDCTPSRYRSVPEGYISDNLPRRYMTSKVAMFYSYNVPLHGYMCWRAGRSSYWRVEQQPWSGTSHTADKTGTQMACQRNPVVPGPRFLSKTKKDVAPSSTSWKYNQIDKFHDYSTSNMMDTF